MSEQLLFSVIIPVYNAEKYLEKCVLSLTNQSIKNIEIILVDDGSPDNSGEICGQLAANDSRITVIHQKNAGPLVARNQGYKIARGEYILNVDSDDYVAENYLERILYYFNEYDCDMVIYNWDYVRDNQIVSDNKIIKKLEHFTTKKDVCKKIFNDNRLNPLGLKAYKRKCMDGMDFNDLSRITNGEDLYRDIQLLKNVESAVFTPEVLYHYNDNPTSITRDARWASRIVDDNIRAEVLEFIKKNNLFNEEELKQYQIYCLSLLAIRLIKIIRLDISKKDLSAAFKKYRETEYYKEFLSSCLPINKNEQIVIRLFRSEKDNLLIDYLRLKEKLGKIKRVIKKG